MQKSETNSTSVTAIKEKSVPDLKRFRWLPGKISKVKVRSEYKCMPEKTLQQQMRLIAERDDEFEILHSSEKIWKMKKKMFLLCCILFFAYIETRKRETDQQCPSWKKQGESLKRIKTFYTYMVAGRPQFLWDPRKEMSSHKPE